MRLMLKNTGFLKHMHVHGMLSAVKTDSAELTLPQHS